MLELDNTTEISYDLYWKDIISLMLEDFVAFFMPDLHPQIDYTVPPVFLEQELDKLLSDLKKRGIRFCDKLVKVKLKNGADRWLFIHIEIQKESKVQFPVRMFIYFYRIYDKYGIDGSDIESIAIFLDSITYKNYNRFVYESGKTKLIFEYRAQSIFDYPEDWLYENKNPFALVILASRKASEKETEAEQIFNFKRKFARLAFKHGIPKYKIVAILQFIYYAMQLPKDLNENFIDYLYELIIPEKMTTLEAKWVETCNSPQFRAVFGKAIDTAIEYSMKEKIKDINLRQEKAMQIIKQQKEEERRQKEEAKRKEAKIIKKSILKLFEKGLSVEEISESLELPKKKVTTIIKLQ